MTELIGVNWKLRAIALTKGNKSLMGALVIAMLGRKCNPPCFAPASFGSDVPADLPQADFSEGEWCGVKKGYPWIDKQGFVRMVYRSSLTSPWTIGHEHVTDFRDRFRRLADMLDLSDADRVAMFDEVKKFLVRDERAVSLID